MKGLAHPIFGIDQKSWHPFKVNDGKDFKVDDCLDSPWILRASESAKAWRNHAEVTVKLSEFGGAYKQAPSFRVDGRTMAPVGQKSGKDVAEKLLNDRSVHLPAAVMHLWLLPFMLLNVWIPDDSSFGLASIKLIKLTWRI